MKLLKKVVSALLVIAFCVTFAGAEAPELTAETAVLIDAETGQVLYDKEMHKQMYPASITKVITIITGLEHLNLSDTITMSHYAVFSLPQGSSHIALDEDEEITVEQAMHAALLRSANDACNGIAEASAGSIKDFTVMMNETAKRAGALNSNFINAHGISEEGHLTTAYDMAMVCRYALKNEDFRKMFGTYKYIMPPNNKKDEERIFINQHQMINGEYEYDEAQCGKVIGGKIGWTTQSKHTLVTVAERDGRTLVAVVMKCPKKGDQYNDTKALFEYGFSEFESLTINSEDFPADSGYTLSAPYTMTVEKGMTPESVTFEFGETEAGCECTVIYPDGTPIATFACEKIPEPEPSPKKESSGEGVSILEIIIMIPLGLIGAFALLVLGLYIRKKFYQIKKRRRQRNRRRY